LIGARSTAACTPTPAACTLVVRLKESEGKMKITVQLQIETVNQAAPVIVEVVTLQREELTPETLGLTLDETKTLLAQTQEALVTHQVAACVAQQ
jgi:hypothetical protein